MKFLPCFPLYFLLIACSSHGDWKATKPITQPELDKLHESYRNDGLVISEDDFDAIWTTAESSEELFTRLSELPSGINSINEDRMWSVLHHYAARTSSEDITELLRLGARVDLRNKDGLTPLHSAAMYCRVEHARLLLEAGADVHATDLTGWTPMFYACFSTSGAGNRIEMIELLTSYGAEVKIYAPYDEYDLEQRTPFELLELQWENSEDKQAKELMNRWESPPRLPKH